MATALGLLETLKTSVTQNSLRKLSENRQTLIVGLSGSQKSLYVAGLIAGERASSAGPTIIVTSTHHQAEKWRRELKTLLSPVDVLLFPALETLPHEEVLVDKVTAKERMEVLQRLVASEDVIVVVPLQAMSQKLMPPQVVSEWRFSIRQDDVIDLNDVSQRLVVMGYERVEKVESAGEFSIRGGIVDVFPLTADQPFRLDLFDDVVDAIRVFDPVTQRSEGTVEEFTCGPATELILPPDLRAKAADKIVEAGLAQADRLRRQGHAEAADALVDRTAAHSDKIREGLYFEGILQYMPFFYAQGATLFSYVASGTVIFDDPTRLKEQYNGVSKDTIESQALLLEKGRILPNQADLFTPWEEIFSVQLPVVYLSALDRRIPGMLPDHVINVKARTPENFHGRFERLASSVRQWRRERFKICIMASTPERGERIVEAFKDEGIEAIQTPHFSGELTAGNVVVTTGELENGVELPDAKLVVLTDAEVFGRTKRNRRQSKSADSGVQITDFGDLKEGDYVVHTNHGIGRYLGVETLEIAGAHKDYLVVKYAGEDKLYVPTDQVDLLQRYYGVDSQPPKLSRLGGNEWVRVKKRVKESVQEMAKGLLELYAERETIQGHAFAPDTVWQAEFEDAFPYEETPDQLRAIEQVKADMSKPRPMDRLLCGDVGYGKTEVAIRAAFKAVMDSKQVAVLVPTTILAQQHGRTFQDRFEGYPVRIRVLSRFQTAAEQNEIIKGLAKGTVDIVIGTHRLLSKDVVFKDLGLVVVDEEQRFGVAQKERLKELRKNVDVLTLSATPIPRTLHMSMVGVRDMSIIETPPEDRLPIRTYVVEYDDDLIREAIMREIGRDGQVYFVYNQVQKIDSFASYLMKLVPEARIAIAHGQMDEHHLERVMLDFLNHEVDVLLCSTIIETGMDIPNVNTLIVYDADRLGLAQLYQLRGRVGRSNRVAYAYFTYRRDKVLNEDAEKRLQAIKEFTELGSGFKIAMRDLEIRGAGNLLGPEQHGFIASVGFELYCRLLEESIKELKGEAMVRPPDPVIDLNVDAFISDDYITDSQQKVEIYKKVVGVQSLKDAEELELEIRDRFGELPQSVKNLLAVARIKVLGRMAGVGSVSSEKDGVVIKMLAGVVFPQGASELTRRYRGRVLALPRGGQIKVKGKGLDESDLMALIEMVVSDLAHM